MSNDKNNLDLQIAKVKAVIIAKSNGVPLATVKTDPKIDEELIANSFLRISEDFYKNGLFENPIEGDRKFLVRVPAYDSYNVFNDQHCRERITYLFEEINAQLKKILGEGFDLNNFGLDYSKLLDINWLNRAREY